MLLFFQICSKYTNNTDYNLKWSSDSEIYQMQRQVTLMCSSVTVDST